jgi:hypothetical protein
MEHIGLTLLGLGFWVFLTVSAVAGIVTEYKKRQLELEPLRTAIERGQQLDPAIIDRLMTREQHSSDPDPVLFKIWGIVAVSSGVGLALLGFFVGQNLPRAVYPIVGSGLLATCVGIGLLICGSVIDRHLKSRAARGPGA